MQLRQWHHRKQAMEMRRGDNSKAARKARTRTLIQLGGLVEKAGLLSFLELEVGQDLQQDPDTFEGVSILLGALLSLRPSFLDEEAEAQKMLWCSRGKEALDTRS